jgi:zinc protease
MASHRTPRKPAAPLALCLAGGAILLAGQEVRGADPQAPPQKAAAAPQKAAARAEPQLPFTRFQLQNGLDVLVHEDHTVPVVAVSVWYHVGSKDEAPGKTGFAHLFEHMMFQGSQHVGDDMHFKYVQQAGGFLNGTTNTDRTNYFEVVPSNFLSRVLYLEADRMGFLLPTLSREKLDNQRDVVRNERRQRYEIMPYGLVPKYLAEALYPEGHPYHHITIGDHKDLEAANLEDVRAFFQRFYVPSNASLVIAGDTTPGEARQLVEHWFGTLPRREAPKTVTARDVPMPVLTGERVVTASDRVTLSRLYLAWHTPAMYRPGDAEMDLLASILGGKSGRLYRRLVYQERIAQDVEVRQQSAMLSSRFVIIATAKEGRSPAELQRVIDDELGKLRRDPPTDAELERARSEREADLIYELESVGGFGGRAEKLQEYLAYAGDPDYLARDLARYRGATPEGVRQALQTYLGPGRVVLSITPGDRPAITSTSEGRASDQAGAKQGVK